MIEPDYIKICEEHDVQLSDDEKCPHGEEKPKYYLVTETWWAILQKRKAEGIL